MEGLSIQQLEERLSDQHKQTRSMLFECSIKAWQKELKNENKKNKQQKNREKPTTSERKSKEHGNKEISRTGVRTREVIRKGQIKKKEINKPEDNTKLILVQQTHCKKQTSTKEKRIKKYK